MGLTNVAFVFMDGDTVIVLIAERSVVALVGKIEKEKALDHQANV